MVVLPPKFNGSDIAFKVSSHLKSSITSMIDARLPTFNHYDEQLERETNLQRAQDAIVDRERLRRVYEEERAASMYFHCISG